MQSEHLRVLAAIVDEGTFEAAADVLRISPSAVGQRIKALETSAGQVVVSRWFTTDVGVDWSGMPVLRFNAKDDLQHRLLQTRGVERPPPTRTVPSSEGFLAAVRAGLGWGMLPELQLGTDLLNGSLVLLEEHAYEDLALHWQTWTLKAERLDRITASIRTAGRQQLRAAQQAEGTAAPRRS